MPRAGGSFVPANSPRPAAILPPAAPTPPVEVFMQTRQTDTLQSLPSVQAFLDDHAAALPGISHGAARTRLDTLVAELESHVTVQAATDFASKGATRKVRALRRALLRAIT
jgi:hypothetical protein